MKFRIHPIIDLIGGPLLIGIFGLLFRKEAKRPLRKRVQDKTDRLVTNGAIATVAAATVRLTLVPVVVWVAHRVERKRSGLLYRLPLPPVLHNLLALLLLDYSMYLWHRINHSVPFLWRFHNVHHTDLDMDVSTAFRFHFGELLLSVFYRSGQVALIGVSPKMALAYEIILEAETEFHHSNWRLPIELERRLHHVVVTPRMHGIHHSIVKRETNSNWGNIFPYWDRLHRTLRLDIPQDAITVGVPAYRDPEELKAIPLLMLPFGPQRDPWLLPDGTRPDRLPAPEPHRQLEP